jgi:PhoPQ-activated pathogenicity-related protein
MRPSRFLMTAASLLATLVAPMSTRADLDSYVQAPDRSFAWSQTANHDTAQGKVIAIDLTSQTWRGIPWKHAMRVYVPTTVTYPDAMILFITGGSNGSNPSPTDDLLGFTLAKASGARVAVLPQVPNQPLMGGKKEDDLIAETFMNYLKDGEADWPLLLPMAKSAVKAMDALQQWGAERNEPVARFVVTGASKRGWTTWLTGAVDRRVVAIAPMVIPTLNMRAQTKHQLEVWGQYSEQIMDYTRRGLTEKFEEPQGQKLWHLVDPYTYRDRLTLPKLQINGTNDRYWTHDSVNVYWDDLKGPSYVVYLPNAGHGLNDHRDYALNGVAALFRHVVSGRPMPKLSWSPEPAADGGLTLNVSAPDAKSVAFWTTTSDTRDFRESKWQEAAGEKANGGASFTLKKPEKGNALVLGDIAFEVDGLPYHLSTQVYEVNAKAAE